MQVELIDKMGTDLTVTNAARRTYGNNYKIFHTRLMGPRTRRGRSDEELLEDLARDGHILPFRHPHIQLSCDAPLFVARQLGKHQVGLTWSEVSRRYKLNGITFYRFNGTWRREAQNRRQGSGELLPPKIQCRADAIQERNILRCIEDFEELMSIGVCLEQARSVLPQHMVIEWTWTGSLLAFIHLWRMRHHPDTQKETRDFAEMAAQVISPLFPFAWKVMTYDPAS